MAGSYRSSWELDPAYAPWISRYKIDPTKFWCRCCEKAISISEKYEKAVQQHGGGPGHVAKLQKYLKLPTAATFLRKRYVMVFCH